MARKKKPLPLLENIEITAFAAEGKSLARIDDMVVFVPYVVPGDIVDLQVTRKKHSFMEAKVVKLHKASDDRVAPVCRHFGVCGGCKWQCLKYERQLHYKQQQVVDTLTRIGKIELPEVKPIIGSRQTLRYRNKLEFSFSNKRWLTEEEISQNLEYGQKNGVGFHIPGAFDKVLDIEECFLMDDLQNKVRNGVKAFAIEHGIEFFDLRNQQGVLRDMVFRTSDSGEVMLTMQFHITNNDERQQADDVMSYIAESYPEITTLVWVNNLKCNDTIGDLDINIYKGRGYVYELMEDLKFKVGPKSFYQTNNEQAYELYKVVRDFASLSGSQLVYDLYTGTGTIANFVAKKAAKVIGIEYVADAIEDAKINSALNNISNTCFYSGDMKDVLTDEFVALNGKPDVVITDPPRAGMHQDVVNVILKSSPDRIVYVSCNPATQARDLALLDTDYRVEAYQPVDMFPHTHHIENVVLLKKR
ncbi:MAG: 23S rRNA (uracil(1939)-C(5))-methyltransferase RlmD [Bacteroidaceae bacterium]|nr:23S rRNA (uracil(1939)-C(5))-methyltransferase RlmD [Prevotellaceae bacterium]MDY3063880.1 23S rRNA (uracil(1939)-C(5))-methyltransferase RlmD [Bacteroidaceae bacterium]